LGEEQLKKLGHNVYLVDFLKYILVKDPQIRPSIDNVLKRFEHIHAILVTNVTYLNNYPLTIPSINTLAMNTSLEGALENYVEQLFPTQETIQEKITLPFKLKHVSPFQFLSNNVSHLHI
jgi:hypothetical protein